MSLKLSNQKPDHCTGYRRLHCAHYGGGDGGREGGFTAWTHGTELDHDRDEYIPFGTELDHGWHFLVDTVPV